MTRQLSLEEVEILLKEFDSQVENPTTEQMEARAKLEYQLRNAKSLKILFCVPDARAMQNVSEAARNLAMNFLAYDVVATYFRDSELPATKKHTLH